jgi:hypothetical protein
VSDPVAVISLNREENRFILRDYSDAAAPRTLCQFGLNVVVSQLIDSRHIVIEYLPNSVTYMAVVDLPAVHYHWFQLPSATHNQFLSVASQLDEIAWLSYDMTNDTDLVHLTGRSYDLVVATLPDRHGGRCGSPDDARQGAYSPSGRHLFVLDQQDPRNTSLLVVGQGKRLLLISPPTGGWPEGGEPNMAVWSHTSETLYYRAGGNVLRWQPDSGAQSFLPGVRWYYPTISPDGAHLAYAVPRPSGMHDVFMIDLRQGGSTQHIGGGARNTPVFLTSTWLWYRTDGQGGCGPSGSRPLIYDLSDGAESSTVVEEVLAVWPATSTR